jgi:leucyl-tRNA synthetase
MPGWAGSSWYFLRYMDAKNDNRFVSTEAEKYWNQVDLYLGGSEHATGHLLYSRFWNLFLYDLGLVTSPEPYKKLINQGMIQGVSEKAYFITSRVLSLNVESFTNKTLSFAEEKNILISHEMFEYFEDYELGEKNIPIEYVNANILDLSQYIKNWEESANSVFITSGGFWLNGQFHNQNSTGLDKFHTYSVVEKMSKSKYNVVNPDDVVAKYGADTLRLFEMFLGPLEQPKPWSTSSIDGCLRFLRKLWRLFYDETGKLVVSNDAPTPAELKILHKTIKKVEDDIERFSFNTSVSTFMVCVNELNDLKSHKHAILEPLLIVLSSYAPHIAEELWEAIGHSESITYAQYPTFEPKYLEESTFEYPISVNGKVRGKLSFPADKASKEIEDEVLASEIIQKWLEGSAVKKVIVVPKKIVNVVI